MKFTKTLNIPEKHVLIIGNRSYRNLWDELILAWTVKVLQEQKKKITIAAYDPERLKIFLHQLVDISKITFVTEIPKGIRSRRKYLIKGKFRERKLWKKANAVIIGWGEIITEENKHSYRYRWASLLPCLKKPRYLMGGIQQPKKNFNRFLFKQILKRTKRIFARDMETVHEIKNYGFDNVEFFMDTSFFAYPRKKIQNSLVHKGGKFKIQNSKNYIVINLNKNAEKFLKEIIKDVAHRYKKGYEVMYVPVAKGKNKHYNDLQYARKIQQWAEIKDQRFTILDREKDFANFTKTIAEASMVISSRLHLFLIANFLWVETKVYPYQKKILKMQQTLKKIENWKLRIAKSREIWEN